MWERFKQWFSRGRGTTPAIETEGSAPSGQAEAQIAGSSISTSTILASQIQISSLENIRAMHIPRATDIEEKPAPAPVLKGHVMTGRKVWVGEDRPSVEAKKEAEQRRIAAEQERRRIQEAMEREERDRERAQAEQRRRAEEYRLAHLPEEYRSFIQMLNGTFFLEEHELMRRGISLGSSFAGHTQDEKLLGLSDPAVAEVYRVFRDGYAGDMADNAELHWNRDIAHRRYVACLHTSLLPSEDFAYYLVGDVHGTQNSDKREMTYLQLLYPQHGRRESANEYLSCCQDRVTSPNYVHAVSPTLSAAVRARLPGEMGRLAKAIVAMPRSKTKDITHFRLDISSVNRLIPEKDFNQWKVAGNSFSLVGLREQFGAHEYVVRGF